MALMVRQPFEVRIEPRRGRRSRRRNETSAPSCAWWFCGGVHWLRPQAALVFFGYFVVPFISGPNVSILLSQILAPALANAGPRHDLCRQLAAPDAGADRVIRKK